MVVIGYPAMNRWAILGCPYGTEAMDENPYEAPRAGEGKAKPIRVPVRWWLVVLWIWIAFFLVALLLPALQPGKSSNEPMYREWQRQQDAERGGGIDSTDHVAPPGL
jgi:hypothetical protein